MNESLKLYKDFAGYNAYPLAEAERIIRERILGEFVKLIEKLEGCEKRAKSLRMIKILEHIVALKHRMNRMKKNIKERDKLFLPAYLKVRITHIDEEKLKKTDFRLVELIAENKDILDSLSCVETDTNIIEKFTLINEHLREMESRCHERALILRDEKI